MTHVRLILIGLLAGLFSALFGVGGGFVIVPLLLVFGNFTPRSAAATSLVAIIFIAAVGAISYAAHGQVKPGAAVLVGLPAMVGAAAGASLQQRLSGRWLSLSFAALLVAIAVDLFVS
jgi:uncharacterized membrane protein YfcA